MFNFFKKSPQTEKPLYPKPDKKPLKFEKISGTDDRWGIWAASSGNLRYLAMNQDGRFSYACYIHVPFGRVFKKQRYAGSLTQCQEFCAHHHQQLLSGVEK